MESLKLIRSIGYPENGEEYRHAEPIESRNLYRLARSNKIGSLYVKTLADSGVLNDLSKEYENRKTFQNKISKTYNNIKKNFPIDYTIVKTAQPFWADSSDIDVIIEGDLSKLKSHLESVGYEISGMAPTALSVRDSETDILIDIQSDFGLFKVKYHDKKSLESETRTIRGSDISVTTRPSDIALKIDHSLTELIFILKEYYSTIHFLESSSRKDINRLINIINKNKSVPGSQAFFTVVSTISQKAFNITPKSIDYILNELGTCKGAKKELEITDYETPFRYPKSVLVKYTLNKFRQHSFRNSFIHQIPYMINPKILYYLMLKVYDRGTRSNYIEESYD